MIDLDLINNLNDQIRIINLKISYTGSYNKNYRKLHINLQSLQEQLVNEWMKIYEPSFNGFETVIIYMINGGMTKYNICDPPYNSKYTYSLANWLYDKLITNQKTTKEFTFNMLPNELKDILIKYDIKNATIKLTKLKEYRITARKVGIDRYEAKIKFN